MTVTDNDGASDSYSTSVFAGHGYEAQYQFNDGSSSIHRVVVRDDDLLQIRTEGSLHEVPLTSSRKDSLNTALSELKSISTSAPASGGYLSPIDIGQPGTTRRLTEVYFDKGSTHLDYRLPEAPKVAEDQLEKAFASWGPDGHAESAAGAFLYGGADAIAETYMEVEFNGSQPAEADLVFSGNFEAYTQTLLGATNIKIEGFLREPEATVAEELDRTIFDEDDYHDSVSLFSPLSPITNVYMDSFSSEGENVLPVTIEPGKPYQIGVRVDTSASTFQGSPLPGNADAVAAYLEGNHSNPAGDLWWGGWLSR